jgi:hypothetical protein
VVSLKERSLPPLWLVGTVASIFLLQVAVTLARPVSTYRLLALGADGTTLGLTAACFAVPRCCSPSASVGGRSAITRRF